MTESTLSISKADILKAMNQLDKIGINSNQDYMVMMIALKIKLHENGGDIGMIDKKSLNVSNIRKYEKEIKDYSGAMDYINNFF